MDEDCSFHPTSVVADPEDCRYYYQCSDGKLYHFYCGASAVFDPTAMSCVSPNTVEKCAGVTTTVKEPEISTFCTIIPTSVRARLHQASASSLQTLRRR